jgi:hypothetical protein
MKKIKTKRTFTDTMSLSNIPERDTRTLLAKPKACFQNLVQFYH